jgi:hypothetical protein
MYYTGRNMHYIYKLNVFMRYGQIEP